MSASALFKQKYLGDWKPNTALIDLATEVCAVYDRRCDASEDPEAPWRSRRGMPTFHTISREEVHGTFHKACSLGFVGTANVWARYVFNTRPPEPRREI